MNAGYRRQGWNGEPRGFEASHDAGIRVRAGREMDGADPRRSARFPRPSADMVLTRRRSARPPALRRRPQTPVPAAFSGAPRPATLTRSQLWGETGGVRRSEQTIRYPHMPRS